MFCCALRCVHSSFAIILMGKRELVALLSLWSWYPVIVVWLFLAVPRVYLQFVIVIFPDHTHYFSVFIRTIPRRCFFCGTFLLFMCYVCLVCSVQPCDYLLVSFVTFSYGVPGQLWYFIVYIPEFCLPLYFNVNYQFLDEVVPCAPAYGVYILQLICTRT